MDERQVMKVAKALADSTRFSIYRTIAITGEICCGEIVNRFPIAQATVSHHLKVLMESGLVDVQRKGQFSYFHAVRDTLDLYRSALGQMFDEGSPLAGNEIPQVQESQAKGWTAC